MHLVGFTVEIYYDARPYERQIFITNSWIWNTCVTLQVIGYKLPKDDTIVSKHVGVW